MRRNFKYEDWDRFRYAYAKKRKDRFNSFWMKSLLMLILFIFSYGLIYIQLHTRITEISRELAQEQKDYLRIKNIEKDLIRQIAEYKAPARIEKLALSIGMIPSTEKKYVRTYSVPWSVQLAQTSAEVLEEANAESGNISFLSKLFTFISSVEAGEYNLYSD